MVRTADLILFVLDVYETNLEVLRRELEITGIRLDTHPPDVVITKTERGGINIKATVKLTKMDEELAKDIVSDFGFVNADVVIRQDVTEDELIDALTGNRIYLKSLVSLNKIDLATKEQLKEIKEGLRHYKPLLISADKGVGLEELRKALFDRLDFIRVYMKPQGGDADMEEPMVIQRGTDIGGVCDKIHRSFRKNFRYALVWGESAKFPGQMVGMDHVLEDGDIISIIVRRGGD